MFKGSLHLHAYEAFHRDDKGGKVVVMLEARLQKLLLLISSLEALLWRLVSVGEGIIVYSSDAVNTVRSSLTEVEDQQIFLLP